MEKAESNFAATLGADEIAVKESTKVESKASY
jgi:hypothetical protein